MDRGAQSAAAHGVKYEQATSTHRAVFISACNEGNQHLIPGQEDRLEQGMATHSNTLAERIPRTEEPGGL